MSLSPPSPSRPRAAFRLLAVLAAPAAIALLLSCASTPARVEVPRVRIDFETYQLPNGLEVILRRDTSLPVVAVNLWYHVGAADERPGRTGFAHLFEHMMFQASGHVPADQFFAILEGAGASLVNGTTDFDRTNYLEDLPSNQLELALWLESDRMGFLLDRLDAVMLANQQDVVRNERRQGIESQPYGLAEERLWHELFPEGHPYRAYVIGSHEDVQAAKLEDVHDFFRRYYCPNNATLAIVGDLDLARTKAWIEKYFATIPRGEEPPVVTLPQPVIAAEKRVRVTDQINLPRLFLGWHSPPAFAAGDAAAAITARILGTGKASRLYGALVYDRKIAQTAVADQQSYQLGSVFQITVTAKPGHTLPELEQAVDAEIARLAAEGPTTEELRAAQTAIFSNIVRGLENVGGFDGVANRLNLYNHYVKDPGYLQKDLERYAAVTPADVKRFAAEVLARDRRVVIECVPGEKVIPAGPPTPPAPVADAAPRESAEPWRHQRPAPQAASTAPLPSATSFELANGLKVWLVESKELPVVAASLTVRAGSSSDPADRPGLAGFTVSLMDEGTAHHDALGLARTLEGLGASLSADTWSDGSAISVRSLKGQAAEALGLLAEVVTTPSFPESEVERVRNDRLTTLLQHKDSPFQTAVRVMAACVFGSGHPYGHLALGTEDGLGRATREEVERFYREAFSPASSALILAGDLDEGEARRLAARAFGRWSGAGRPVPTPGAADPIAEKVVIVDTPTAPQTALLLAQTGVPRSHPDYEKLNVMNQVLGGLFASRVNMNLRERHGYSYGAFSFMRDNRGAGPLLVGSMVRTDVTGPALAEMLKEVRAMKEAPVSDEELKLARESIARSLPALFMTSESTVGTVAHLYLFDQPPDYYQTLPERLASLTAAEVFEATRAHLSPEDMKVIAVGDRRQIEAPIRRLNLGPVTFRTNEAKPFAAAP